MKNSAAGQLPGQVSLLGCSSSRFYSTFVVLPHLMVCRCCYRMLRTQHLDTCHCGIAKTAQHLWACFQELQTQADAKQRLGACSGAVVHVCLKACGEGEHFDCHIMQCLTGGHCSGKLTDPWPFSGPSGRQVWCLARRDLC